MKKFNFILISFFVCTNICLLQGFCGTDNGEISEQTSPIAERDMVLWYRQPGQQWLEGLPIGNGFMGGMVFGRIQEERIALNEHTFWSGRPHDYTNPDAYKYYPKIKELVFSEKYQEADKMADDHFLGIPKNQQAYQPLGDLLLSFSGGEDVKDYYRELDMETGIVKITYMDGEVQFTREVFMSYPDRAMVMRVSCDKPERLSVEAKLKSPYLDETMSEEGKLIMKGKWKGPVENRKWSLMAPVEGEGLSFEAILMAYPEGGNYGVSDSSLIINDANSITFVLTAATSFKNYANIYADASAKCEDILRNIAEKDYETLRQRHENDFRSLMGRVHLDIGDTSMNNKPTDQRVQEVNFAMRETNQNLF